METHEVKQQVTEVCRKIKGHRLAKGYSPLSIAEKAGISINTLRKIENCQTKLTVARLIAIAGALDISVLDLLK
jgi:transcriptional regulator with XRE-family HTH domain